MSNQVAESTLKIHLGEILDRASKGEEIAVTRNGDPIAVIGPPSAGAGVPPLSESDGRKVIEEMIKLREGNRLDGISIRELIEEGRRY